MEVLPTAAGKCRVAATGTAAAPRFVLKFALFLICNTAQILAFASL